MAKEPLYPHKPTGLRTALTGMKNPSVIERRKKREFAENILPDFKKLLSEAEATMHKVESTYYKEYGSNVPFGYSPYLFTNDAKVGIQDVVNKLNDMIQFNR